MSAMRRQASRLVIPRGKIQTRRAWLVICRAETARPGSMMSETRTDCYGYNDRSELVSGTKDTAATNLTEYAYQYDDIGNRIESLDLGTNRTYVANSLNQYTNITEGAGGFLPQFDNDGNQTLIKTATGDWQVTYNGENRPVLWECESTNIVMKFDRMGRRVEYVETVNGVTNAHHRFVYDGYLCVQRLNGANNNAVDLAFGWDPTEPVATRPLWMQRVSGTYNFFYFHDGNKNVSDLVSYQTARGVPAHYEYAPFGELTVSTTNTDFMAFNVADANPFRFSSEYSDDTLGLVYYNYRHYEPVMGRWCAYDQYNTLERYQFLINNPIDEIDLLGEKRNPGRFRYFPPPLPPPLPPESHFKPSTAPDSTIIHEVVSSLARIGYRSQESVISAGKSACSAQSPENYPATPNDGGEYLTRGRCRCCYILYLKRTLLDESFYYLRSANVYNKPCVEMKDEYHLLPIFPRYSTLYEYIPWY
ncbi:MAG: hypothetical protein IJQ34_08370 [Kiritimatiellae bacterium]|nr:hypothetical protein [Kiritimatiellia bacterium]